MRLLFKTSFVYFITTALVFIGGGIIFYYNLQGILDEEVNEKLNVQKDRIEKYISEHDSVPALPYDHNAVDEIRPCVKPVNGYFADTVFYSKEEEEDLPYRMFIFSENIHGSNYLFRVSKPLFESDDLSETILGSFGIVALILLVVFLVLNYFISGKLWKPFFRTMQELKEFKLEGKRTIEPVKTSTKEFRQLNEALIAMTEKARNDFRNMKSFTENASHELQTPLSVILAETEQMLQTPSLNEEQLNSIQSINQTTRKLSRLNQSLLLLAKISNRQFEAGEKTDMSAVVNKKLDALQELITFKELDRRSEIAAEIKWPLHHVLAEVLVNNLLSNAIRHTETKGQLRITLANDKLVVANSGDPLSEPEKIFERFYKESSSSESTGLGLAIVKQICETCGLKAGYSYEAGMHTFAILH